MSLTNDRGRGFSPSRPTSGLAVSLCALAVLGLSQVQARAEDDGSDDGSTSFSEKLGASVANSMNGVKNMLGMGRPQGPPQDPSPSGCPEITVLDGTGAQRIMANQAAGSAGLRYQYSINDVGRECQVSGNQMVLKVGVAGRVLLGPSGSPGSFDVPIRIAVVDGSDHPAASRLYKVAASIRPGQGGTPYTLVADSLTVPIASGRSARDYTIKIGIDTAGKGEAAGPKPGRHHKASKPETAATR